MKSPTKTTFFRLLFLVFCLSTGIACTQIDNEDSHVEKTVLANMPQLGMSKQKVDSFHGEGTPQKEVILDPPDPYYLRYNISNEKDKFLYVKYDKKWNVRLAFVAGYMVQK